VQVVLDLAITLLGLGIFGQHVWALKGHFASDRMTSGARTISLSALFTCAVMLWLIWEPKQPVAAQLVGAAIMALSVLLFRAAVRASEAARLKYAFDPALPKQLVTDGPYGRVRHPFYASYLLYWGGWAVATWSLWSVPPLAILAALYTIAARYEESLLGNSNMAADYAIYRQRVGFFWPRL
jgi:protein-S-isoprenylcysteine O-methyltransferase Ste14